MIHFSILKIDIIRFIKAFLAIGALCVFASCQSNEPTATDQKINKKHPNVIYILADDLGFGDVHALNQKSIIPTPNMDRLAKEGAAFLDAHSGSAVCTPTRYGVLTGRYAWRTRLKRGVLRGYSKHLIDPNRTTVANLFQQSGYKTACIGKWHLGMDMPLVENHGTTKFKINSEGRIKNGPNVNGFDYFYGISASLDFPPYGFMENDRFTKAMTDTLPLTKFPKYARAGERDEDFKLEDCLDILTTKATAYIRENAQQPFFLYLPLTAPHKPVLPHERFRGSTPLGPYGDFVTQVDWTIGELLNTLDELGIAKNTLVILTSDNGSFMKRIGEDSNFPEGSIGHVKDQTIQAFAPANHQPNANFRGTKADIYEAGHRVPFLVRWPEQIQAATLIKTPICLTDFYGTVADLLGQKHQRETTGEDSFSFLPLLNQSGIYQREPIIHHSSNGMFAMRKGDWKLILGNGSGGRQAPRGKPFNQPYQLYNLANDEAEKMDVSGQNPKVMKELLSAFDSIHTRTESLINH
jgi:arylsulfatase A-like enzyme